MRNRRLVGIQSILRDTLADTRFTLRLARRQLVTSLATVLTLALGIAGGATVLVVFDAAVVRSVPFPRPEELVRIRIETPRDNRLYQADPSLDQVRVWSADNKIFSKVGAAAPTAPVILLNGAAPRRTKPSETWRVTAGFLELLQVPVVIGRAFWDEDCRESAPLVALLGYSEWQAAFGGDEHVIGRTLRFRQRFATADDVAVIVGVLPSTFWPHVRFVLPLSRSGEYQQVVGRLTPRLSLVEAENSVFTPDGGPAGRVRLSSLRDEAEQDRNPEQFYFLAVGAAFVLLLVCINVAVFSLARGAGRTSELSVRAAAGATRGRLVRQLVTEHVVLASFGGVVGLAIALAVLEPAIGLLLTGLLPPGAQPRLSVEVVFGVGLLVVLTAVVAGLVPALRLSRSQLFVRVGGTETLSPHRRTGQALITIQVAVTVIVHVCAGLLVASYLKMVTAESGFDRRRVIAMEAAPVDQDTPATVARYYPALLSRIRSLPDVESAGLTDAFRSSSPSKAKIGEGAPISVTVRHVSPGALEALDAQVRQGRMPVERDVSGAAIVVLSESAAQRLLGLNPAIGSVVNLGGADTQVIGVVADLNYSAPFPSGPPDVYIPFETFSPSTVTVVVRPKAEPLSLAKRLVEAAQASEPAVVDHVKTGDALLHSIVSFRGERTALAGLVATITLLVAVLAVFATASYAAARRTQEIGLRIALGASQATIIRQLSWDSFRPVLLGIAIGLAGSELAGRIVAKMLYKTEPGDLATLLSVAAILGGVTILTTAFPAWRTGRIDPARVLSRHEMP